MTWTWTWKPLVIASLGWKLLSNYISERLCLSRRWMRFAAWSIQFFFFIYFILLQPRSLNASACLLVAHWSILLQLWSNHSAEGADALSQPRPPPPCFGHVTRAYEDGGSFVFPEVKPPRLKPKHPALRGLRVHCSGAGLVWQSPAFGDRVSDRSVS